MTQSLDRINELLAPVERDLISGCSAPRTGPIVIVGAPRSGHTYLSQLLARSGRVTYISNFTARFWMAPVLADRMQHALGLVDQVGLDSKFGRTVGHSGPHEGGNFLRRFIHFSETHVADRPPNETEIVEWRKEVAALEAEHNRPVMLRNVIYGLNLRHVFKAFPYALIVVCNRNPEAHVASILKCRAMHSGVDEWWSVRPDDFQNLQTLTAPADQVRGQIASCYRLIRQSAAERSIEIDLEHSTADPVGVVGSILRRV